MILVAGGTGRLGRMIVDRLVGRGLAVRVLTRDVEHARPLLDDRVEVVAGDVRDDASLALALAMAGVEIVVSAVQGFIGPGKVTPSTVDRDGNLRLIAAARAVDAEVIMMSVLGAAAASPIELSRMKFAAEEELRRSGVRSTVIRAAPFLDTWVEILEATAVRSGRPLVFGRGNNPISFVSVGDVAELVERVVVDPSTRGSVLQIRGPNDRTLNQLAAAVQAKAARRGTVRHVPPLALSLTANTIGRMKPQLGRQARMALAMDSGDFTFDSTADGFTGAIASQPYGR
ncbi:SDR family oxidoreductase [Parafrigoribacterium soli]|uniref:SDR family oxidoreductase n=1 Tax=Parafrigoribacterium soli TaxID=3144663 RepID=UPI0032EB0A98